MFVAKSSPRQEQAEKLVAFIAERAIVRTALGYSSPVIPLSAARLREQAQVYQTAPPELACIDVWLISTSLTAEDREAHWSVLSNDEREQAERFLFERDRDRFIAAKGSVRMILSACCGVLPERVAFKIGSRGKPSLLDPAMPWEFNLSHSGDCALAAIVNGAACGVDIEAPRPRVSATEIARRFFCPREIEWLKHSPNGFLRLWTAKEAVIKAVGLGLSIPLTDFDVTDIVDGNASSIVLQTRGMDSTTIWLQELKLVEGYSAAVAVEGLQHSVRIFAEQ